MNLNSAILSYEQNRYTMLQICEPFQNFRLAPGRGNARDHVRVQWALDFHVDLGVAAFTVPCTFIWFLMFPLA